MAEEIKQDPQKAQQRKVIIAAAIMLIPFCFCMYLIFGAGTKKEPDAAGANGVNVTIPDGKAQKTEGNKQKAVEKVRSQDAQAQRLQSLGDDAFSLLDDGKSEEPKQQENDPVKQSQEANRAMQEQARSFYRPTKNPEVEALKEQVETLNEQLEAQRATSAQMDPIALAEKQYQLAQKYLGNGTGAAGAAPATGKKSKSKKSLMRPVRESDVSASTLNPTLDFSQERNMGFNTATRRSELQANTIRACIAEDQVIRVGGMVRLRLLDAVRIEGVTIPRNTTLYGMSRIDGIRLQVVVSSIEYGGRIFDVNAMSYDLDGQPGLNIPDSRERRAIKEALASIGQSAGMSVNVTKSAGQQIVSDLSRSAISATTKYVAEKLKEVKITLKANYQLLLISEE